ncbi:MAG: hypothetical protein P8Y92_16460 [Halioglobus sp.]
MNPDVPSITIHVGPDGIRIDQRRPQVTSLLTGMSAATALARISSLLPICGGAQTLAARRAIEAARNDPPGREAETQREASLWREQAHAAAWRLAIDWPDLLGESRDLTGMRQILNAGSGVDVARALARYLPGLGEVADPEGLLDWAARTDCSAARLLRQAMAQSEARADHGGDDGGDTHRMSGDALSERARAVFDAPTFDARAPGDEAVEVGPAAMARDPLIPALDAVPGMTAVARRLFAQVLDTHIIASRLLAPLQEAAGQPQRWTLADGKGMGRAQTARGPVFHRVSLDPHDGETVTDWRVLAPTDWHFSPRGPLARSAGEGPQEESWLRLLIAGFDPCAPWTIMTGAGEGGSDA